MYCLYGVCLCHGGLPWCMWRGQRTVLWSQFCLSTFMKLLGIELRPPALYNKCLYLLSNLTTPPFFNGRHWSLEIRNDTFVTQRLVATSSSQLKAEALMRRNSAFHFFLSSHRQCDILEHIPLIAKAVPMDASAILMRAVLLSVCRHAALI